MTLGVGWLARRPRDGSGPSVERATWRFLVAGLLAIGVTLARTDLVPPNGVAVLVFGAAACVSGLTVRRAPSLAWLAAIGGSFAATSLPIEQARAADPVVLGVAGWSGWSIPAGLSALITLQLGFAYATRPGRRIDPIAVPIATILLGWLAVAFLVTLAAVAAGQRADPAFNWVDVATLPIATFSPFVVSLVALGAAADVRAAVGRARERLGPGFATARGAEAAWALAAATLRELVPGQAAAEEATVAAERTRLAGDLHAAVLPGLRRAIAEAETGGDPDALAQRLRTIDRELERLMADRWPVVLEAFGLVAAIEDLAEQVEADDELRVEIDVDRAGERPPAAVERAAWRVAQLAVDNAVRHAAATTIAISVAVDAGRVVVAIGDDGRGFEADPDVPSRRGARGLADATRRSVEVGATVRVETKPGGGTRVVFDWTARP